MQMTNSGRLQLNTSTYKGFDIIDADIQGITPNKNSALNIISDKTDSDNNINFLHVTSVNNQSIDTGNLKIYFLGKSGKNNRKTYEQTYVCGRVK